ncbi:hypothetical protein EMIHUDRAFT_468406, partial [Emiliania huxleyi CCMP1516]|uniref:Protein NLRC3 n=2 Tax=Emiliania huxleyi TaxID=2903 RepID=A0A0D3K3V5_EMIH1
MACFSSRVESPTEELPGPPAVERDAPTPADNAAPPAAALPSATDRGVSETKLEEWRKRGGGDLEPVLASGAVALLDAQWIIGRAEAGGVLTHRQALPKEAFLSLADLVEATTPSPKLTLEQQLLLHDLVDLPVAALSSPWLTPSHPDPRGANLARVAKALEALLTSPFITRLGVFWDFGSLHQHPDAPNGVMRTEEQNALFKQGLGCLGTLYSHPHTIVLRLTSFPDVHKAEEQAEGTNVAKYFDRGWCYLENSLASLGTKDGARALDLGLMRDDNEYDYRSLIGDCKRDGGRRPPLLPSAFAAELEAKTFTNGKDDKPLVQRLYEAAFEEQFGKATKLGYYGLGWGDAEAAQLAEVLASGAAPRLETLNLGYNEIDDEGCKALVAALGKEGAAPRLETLRLDDNQIGEEGCEALAAVLKEGAPRLKELNLYSNQIGEEGCEALAAALKEGAPQLEKLSLDDNQIGDEGCEALAAALKEGAAPRLEMLSLTENEIGENGCEALAAAFKEGALGVVTVRVAVTMPTSVGAMPTGCAAAGSVEEYLSCWRGPLELRLGKAVGKALAEQPKDPCTAVALELLRGASLGERAAALSAQAAAVQEDDPQDDSAGAWRSEWAELYAENLEQSGAARVSGVTRDAAWVAEHEPLSKWLSKLEGSDIAPLVALGAPRHEAEAHEAEAYACLTSKRWALARRLRERDRRYAGSTFALCDAIVAQALRQGDAGDSDFAPTFTNLRGLNSLANSDPAWERLTVPDSTGFCGVCSSSLVAADFGTGASAFTSCGHAVYHRNAAGNVSFEPQDSPVVRFDSAPEDEHGLHCCVVIKPGIYAVFPPNTLFRLKRVEPPGWTAPNGVVVEQPLYVVSATYRPTRPLASLGADGGK